MRLSKKLILRTAEELRRERGHFTQRDIHMAIEEKLGRHLTMNEKRRVTMILRNEYVVKNVERDPQYGYSRIYIFL